MPIPYIWLGDNTEVSGQGELAGIPVDRWTVRPLLGWARDDTNDRFTPALLVHDDNPALQTLLEVLDAEQDQDPVLINALKQGGSPIWRVYRFDRLTATRPRDQLNLAKFDATKPLLQHKASPSVSLDGPASATAIGPGGLITLVGPPVLTVETTGDGGAVFVLSMAITQVDARKLGFDAPFSFDPPLPVTIEYDSASGQVKVNDTLLNGQSVSDQGSNSVPIGRIFLTVEQDAAAQTRRAGIDIPISGGDHTIAPLVRGIPGSKVTFHWNEFLVRLRKGRLGIALPKPTADELGTATFAFPLIQAEGLA